LLDNWRYFFPGKVTISSVSGPSVPLENGEQFLALLHAVVAVLAEQDLVLFTANLALVEELNTCHKLYARDAFREALLPVTVHTLLGVLLARSHELLRDAVLAALYNMASVDFAAFFHAYVPEFVRQAQGGGEVDVGAILAQLGTELDMPTFTAGLDAFLSDLALQLAKAA